MYPFKVSFVFMVLKISPPQKVGNIIFLPFIICSPSFSSCISLLLLSFFTKPPIIFKISLSKSNKLNGFGSSSFKISVLESNTLICFGLSSVLFLFCFILF